MQSPLKLFKSLKHGDPQAVAITAVSVFFASVCWFSWTLLAPQKSATLPFGGGRVGRQTVSTEPSLREVLEAQRAYLTPDNAPNPFYRAPPAQKPPKERPVKNADGNQNAGNQNQQNLQNSTPNNPVPAAPPVPPPTTRPVTLTYRGSLKRPDQTTVALIAVTENNTQRFIETGDAIESFTINEISPEGIQIQQSKGPAIFLPRGVAHRFEVPL